MDFYGKTIGTRKFVRYIAMSAMEGCPLSRVSLYRISVMNDVLVSQVTMILLVTIPYHKEEITHIYIM